jgi:hypothetical protein
MMMEKLVEWTVLARETEVLGENLPRSHFVHDKSHLADTVANPGLRGGKPATYRFSCGAASAKYYEIVTLELKSLCKETQRHDGVWGSWCVAPPIFNISIRLVSKLK